MKKNRYNALCMILMLLTWTSCDSAQKNNSDSGSVEIKGDLYEAEHFTMTIASGFNTMDIQGGVQASRGNDVVEVWVRGHNLSEDTAEKQAQSMANRYDGTNPQTVQMLGLKFYCTSFEVFNLQQTICIAIKDGKQIQVGITGRGHTENATLQGMRNSIAFK